MAAISDTRGYAPISSELGTSAQKCLKREGPVPFSGGRREQIDRPSQG
jgi:hypothetical protein